MHIIKRFRPEYFFLLAVLFFFLTSCSKSKDGGSPPPGSDYYMRFKVNGTLVEYKGQLEGTYNKGGGNQYSSGISGLKEVFVANKNNMTLALATSAETQTGITYTNYTTSESGSAKALVSGLAYYDDQGKFYMTWSEEFIPAIPVGTEINSKIKVTEQTSDYLKGVFSGVMYNSDYSVKLVITEGEFYVVRKT